MNFYGNPTFRHGRKWRQGYSQEINLYREINIPASAIHSLHRAGAEFYDQQAMFEDCLTRRRVSEYKRPLLRMVVAIDSAQSL